MRDSIVIRRDNSGQPDPPPTRSNRTRPAEMGDSEPELAGQRVDLFDQPNNIKKK